MYCLCILAYNEEDSVKMIVEKYLNHFELIIIVNDGSQDQTSEILNKIQYEHKKIKIITNSKNKGAGYSLQKALDYFNETDLNYLIKIDGDNQFEESDVIELIKYSKNFDFIKCDRFWEKGIKGTIPQTRYFGNAFASLLLKISTGNWRINDPLNGLFLFSSKITKKINIPNNFKRYGYPFYLTNYISHLSFSEDIKIGQMKNTIEYFSNKKTINIFVMFFKLISYTLRSFIRKISIKFKNSKLQLSGFYDIFFLINLCISLFSTYKVISVRYFDQPGQQGTWTLVFLFFIFLSGLFFNVSQKHQTNFLSSKFENIN